MTAILYGMYDRYSDLPPPTAKPVQKRNNHLALFLAIYIAVVGLSAWAGYYFYADYSLNEIQKKAKNTNNFQTDMSYVDLPRISVTLSSSDRRGMVRMDITLEVENKYASQIEGYRSRITDRLIHYAQTLSYEDVSRAKSVIWLKPDMLQEVTHASNSLPIKDLIFREFIVL